MREAITLGERLAIRVGDYTLQWEPAPRVERCFKEMGIKTVGQLVLQTEADLLSHRSFGRESLRQVKEMLNKLGLHLGMVFYCDEPGRRR